MFDQNLNVIISGDSEQLQESLQGAAESSVALTNVTKSLESATNDAKRSTDGLAASMKKLEQATNDSKASTEGLSKETKRLEQTTRNSKESTDSLTKETKQLEQTTGKAKDSIDALTEATGRLTDATNDTKEQYKELTETLKKSNIAASQGEKLQEKLAASVYDGMKKAAEAVHDIVLQTAELVEKGEELGITAGAYQSLEHISRQTGLGMSTVTGVLDETRKKITQAAAGNETLVQTFGDLGLRLDDLKRMTPDQQFLAVSDALSSVSDENERARLGTAVLGEQYAKVSKSLGQFNDLAGEAKEKASFISDEDANAAKAYKDTIDELGRIFDKLIQSTFGKIITQTTADMKALFDYFKDGGGFGDLFYSMLGADIGAEAATKEDLAEAKRKADQRRREAQQKEAERQQKEAERQKIKQVSKERIEAAEKEKAAKAAAEKEAQKAERDAERAQRDALKAEADAVKAAEQERIRIRKDAEKQSLDATKKRLDAEKKLSAEQERQELDRLKKRAQTEINAIGDRIAALKQSVDGAGFDVTNAWNVLNETPSQRKKRMNRDGAMSQLNSKISRAQAGETVHFTWRERKLIEQQHKKQLEIAALEKKKAALERKEADRLAELERKAVQSRFDAAKQEIEAAKALKSSAEALLKQTEEPVTEALAELPPAKIADETGTASAPSAVALPAQPNPLAQSVAEISKTLSFISKQYYIVQG